MFCLSGPLFAAFGDNCVSKNDSQLNETCDVSANNHTVSKASFPYLEMDDTNKVPKIRCQQSDDKTDSESSRSSQTPDKGIIDVQILKTIGSGRFGFVRIGYWKDTNNYVLLNSYQKSILSDTCQQHIPKREKDTLELLDHPLVVKLLGSFQDMHSLYLLLNVPRGGELSRLLMVSSHLQKNMRSGSPCSNIYNLRTPLTESQKMFYAACVVSVFKYAHSKNVLHRGLHPDTLYIDEAGYLKVTDWGFSKICDDHTFTLCGHVEYLCPEAILYDSGYGKGADYWALGVLIYEMLADRSAFVVRSKSLRPSAQKSTHVGSADSALGSKSVDDGAVVGPGVNCPAVDSNHGFDDASTVENIISGQIEFPSDFSAAACSIVSGLCQKNPAMRLGCVKNSRGIRDIMSHPWFSGLDWELLESCELAPPWVPNMSCCGEFRYFGEGYSTEDSSPAFDGYHHLEWNAF